MAFRTATVWAVASDVVNEAVAGEFAKKTRTSIARSPGHSWPVRNVQPGSYFVQSVNCRKERGQSISRTADKTTRSVRQSGARTIQVTAVGSPLRIQPYVQNRRQAIRTGKLVRRRTLRLRASMERKCRVPLFTATRQSAFVGLIVTGLPACTIHPWSTMDGYPRSLEQDATLPLTDVEGKSKDEKGQIMHACMHRI